MVLLVHLLFGALIGKEISNPFLAIILAFFGHYFLDFLPHIEYPIKNIKNNQWRKAAPDISRVASDFSAGILLIFLFSNNHSIIYVCAFFAILPDGFSLLNSLTENKILAKHSELHQGKLHFLENKKIPKFWRIFSQVIVVVICIYFLKF
ncbi:MAG: hypothetical protein ABSA74_00560 [Candidatus Staskawiczbacteria bacterium]|jgi:hypothetical protein